MPRNRIRVSKRGKIPLSAIEEAANLVRSGKGSYRFVAESVGVSAATLCRFIARTKKGEQPRIGYNPATKVFTAEQEDILKKYVISAQKRYYGLSSLDLRKLANQVAQKYKVKHPTVWEKDRLAGREWIIGFLSKHASLSVRTPQATSYARATAFNKHTVSVFFDKLHAVFIKHKFKATDIYNFDETGLTTCHKPGKVIATKGSKNVGAMTCGERGTLVTVGLAVNACGNVIPPIFLYPRQRDNPLFLNGAPSGSVGRANGTGWMSQDDFLFFMQHFVACTRACKASKVLLLLDNHHSHISVEVIDYSKANGVVMLTLPPHCTHKMQPLDRSVFGPLKAYYNSACTSWMANNPGTTMRIDHIASLVGQALPKATRRENIENGFKVCGIFPYNRDVFDEDDYQASAVSDRPILNAQPDNDLNLVANAPNLPSDDSMTVNNETHPSIDLTTPNNRGAQQADVEPSFNPEDVRPLPVAPPRKTMRRGNKRHTAILTDTPERNALHDAELAHRNKKSKKRIDFGSSGGSGIPREKVGSTSNSKNLKKK